MEKKEKDLFDIIFGETPSMPDFSKMSTETLIKVYKLDEPKIWTFIKGLGRVILAIVMIAICVVMAFNFFTSKPTVVVTPTPTPPPVVEQLQNKPVDKTPVVKPPVVEEKPIIDTDFEIEEDVVEDSNSSSSSFLGDLLASIFKVIIRVATSTIDCIKNIPEKINGLLEHVDGEKVYLAVADTMNFIREFKSKICGRINESVVFTADTKKALVNVIEEYEPTETEMINIVTYEDEVLAKIYEGIEYLENLVSQS